jgi:arylsulfatase
VIFLSDNGPWIVRGENGGSAFPLRNGKTSSYEGGFRVPCVMWGPGILKNPGRVSDEILSSIDFLPTFVSLAGIDFQPKKTIDGHDATALITGDPNAKSPWPHFYYYFGTELHAVRENQYKFRAQNILQNEDIYRRDDFANVPMPATLYDLSRDLGEQKSVLKDHPQIEKHLESLLAEERQILGDTLTNVKGSENRKPGFSEHPVNPEAK